MRALLTAIFGAALLALTACGGSTSTVYVTRPSAAPPPSAAPVATASVNPDAHACWAFHQAITKGVPASAGAQTTMEWGCGFDTTLPRDGFGPIAMRERVHSVGGELSITSAPGRGSKVSVAV